METTLRRTDPLKKKAVRRKKLASRNRSSKRVSRLRKPVELSLETWQVELRRQFGREQDYRLENIGEHPFFSEFHVTNPESKNVYRVAVRGTGLGDNYCSCPDFATNTLGTCKHVEFTLAKLRRKRGGVRALKAGFQPSYSEVFLQYGPRRDVRFRPGSDCDRSLARLASRYFDSDGVLLPEAFAKFDVFLSKAARIEPELRCYEDVLGFVAELRDQDHRHQRVRRAFPRGVRSAAFNKLLSVPLYDYQREGALFASRAGRCLIGDEMGLGKTVEAIAAVEIMARHLGVERVLLVCPTSLKHQWEREVHRFVDRSVQVISGPAPVRKQRFADESFYKITNYDTVHRDLESIEGWSPDLVILDEAQRIKNWETRTANSVKKIASPYAFVLTGTPLENRLEELVSIVQFIDRHRLGPTFRFLADHQVFEEGSTRVVGYRNLDRIGKTLEPILIRRRKKDVLKQLPQRLEKNFFVPMTPQQIEHHEENREIVSRIVAKWRRYHFLPEADQRRLMIALQNMRMACDSTYLLDQNSDFGVKADELVTVVDEMFECPEVKVVVFSQWVRMHELLIRRLEGRGWDHVFFHGGVPGDKRKLLVDRFREDGRCRAFLATDAGGVGLNLQHASAVVNMDLPWNPAILEQRIGRVHRLGQQRPVQVVNFVAQGAIEEGMLSLLGFKKSLFAGVLDGGEKEVFLGGSRLKRFIQTVETAVSKIPETGPENGAGPPASETASDAVVFKPDPRGEEIAAAAPTDDPLMGLLRNGLALLEQFTAASQTDSAKGTSPGPGNPRAPFEIARDEQTGQNYVKMPLPASEVLDRALDAVQTLVKGLRT